MKGKIVHFSSHGQLVWGRLEAITQTVPLAVHLTTQGIVPVHILFTNQEEAPRKSLWWMEGTLVMCMRLTWTCYVNLRTSFLVCNDMNWTKQHPRYNV